MLQREIFNLKQIMDNYEESYNVKISELENIIMLQNAKHDKEIRQVEEKYKEVGEYIEFL